MQSDLRQQIAELPRASLGYKQLNKTLHIATSNTSVPSTYLEVQLVRVRHASSGDGVTRRVEQFVMVHYSVGVMI
jgi:hypothetical protein